MGYIEKVDGYSIDQDDKGVTGTRVFVGQTGSEAAPGGSAVPEIGDLFFSGDDPEGVAAVLGLTTDGGNLICRKRTLSFVNGDQATIVITCHYSNEPVDFSQYGDGPPSSDEFLPSQYKLGGEFQLFNPNVEGAGAEDSPWTWASDGGQVLEPIPVRVRTYTKTIERVIKAADYSAYMDTIGTLIGKVNDATAVEQLPGGEECWLFVGADSEVFCNHEDKVAYRYSLVFQYRDPDDTDERGWQKVMRRDGSWDRPQNGDMDGAGIYLTGDMSQLFS